MTKGHTKIHISSRYGEEVRYRVDCPCCEDNLLVGAVYLSYTSEQWDAFHEGRDFLENTPPRWFVAPTASRYVEKGSRHDIELIGPREAKFCPFCGKPVPPVRRKRQKFEKLLRILDGGYYCETCGERLQGCSCVPPFFLWEAVIEGKTDASVP